MSPWLSHVLMHQKGLKKAWLVACAVITHWNPVLQSFPGCRGCSLDGICFPWCVTWPVEAFFVPEELDTDHSCT